MTRACLLALFSAAWLSGAEWHRAFEIAGRADVRVQGGDGPVTVRGWTEKRVSAMASARGSVDADAVQQGDRVDVTVRSEGSTRLDVRVPSDCRLSVQTGSGPIQVWDVAGEVRLISQSGDIEAVAVDGALEIRDARGRVGARGRFDSLLVRGGFGAIDIGLMPGSKLAGGATVESDAGPVHLRLPPGFAGDLDVRTRGGEIAIGIEAAPQRHDDRRWLGKLNGGGVPVTVRTRSGTVRIDRL